MPSTAVPSALPCPVSRHGSAAGVPSPVLSSPLYEGNDVALP